MEQKRPGRGQESLEIEQDKQKGNDIENRRGYTASRAQIC